MASREAVIEQMAAADITGLDAVDLVIDGQIHRFRCADEKKENGWYVLFEFVADDGQRLITGAFGSWKLGVKHTVSLAGVKFSRAERQRFEAEHAKKAALAEQSKADLQRTAAERAADIWKGLKPHGKSPYLENKRIKNHGGRFGRGGAFAVPIKTSAGDLVNLQFIHVDGKRFLTGGQVAGCFHVLGKISPEEPIIICEGYATAAALYESLKWPVACAFNAHNLRPVAEAMRAAYPYAQLVIAGDMDLWTRGNPGQTCARLAAREARAALALPAFQELQEQTDFHDLFLAEGCEAVAEQVKAAIRDVPDWKELLAKNKDGKFLPTISNTFKILLHDPQWRGVLAYCEFSYRLIKRRKPPFGGKPGEWTDSDAAEARIWLCEHFGVSVRKSDLDDAVIVAAKRNPFHPVREYFERLVWDGIPRVDYWLCAYLDADDSDYVRAAGRKFLIGAVARAMEAPVKMDYVLILEGMQGARKSTVLSRLAGAEWFSDTYFAIGDKDGYQQMQGVLIYELAELDSFNKVESTRAKQFFGSMSDRYRVSYGHHVEDFPRQGVFAGTCNQDAKLKDPTGNRRYWPVKCGRVDIEALTRAKDMLWAEALALYRQGEPWWPSDEEQPLFDIEQEKRYTIDAWEPTVDRWLNNPEQRSINAFTLAEIMQGALEMTPALMRPPEQQRVGTILGRLGWSKSRLRRTTGGGRSERVWAYMRPYTQRLKGGEVEGNEPF